MPHGKNLGWALCALAVLAAAVVPACDQGASCPGHPCDPPSDGTPFDLIDYCQTTGTCLRDGLPAIVCHHPDASPPPTCALGPVDSNETLTFPLGSLAATLGGRRDLVITYAQCERDGAPPDLMDLAVFYDGVPAACEAANPCDPSATPTVLVCRGVPASVTDATLSFSYGGAQGKTSLSVEMLNTTCSYLCT
jgi:hypothetical protein